MTVTREQQRIYPLSRERLVAAVRQTLSDGSRYRVVQEGSDGTFEVVYEPWLWLILTTPFSVRVERVGDSAAVTMRTQSQFMILCDLFGFYDRYIVAFFDALRRHLQSDQPDDAMDRVWSGR